MDQIKGLTNSIDLATSDMQQGPSEELYSQVLQWVLSRADMYFLNNEGPSIASPTSPRG